MIGSILEYYDFFIYGPLAALVFADVFFSSDIPDAVGTLLALLTFGVGFLSRPFGGVVMGHFGDKLGRKSMLLLSFMIMGLVTVAIGLLPSYATIGVAAPILLTVLRFIQGFGIGGEWGGAALLAVESAPENKKHFFGSLVQASAPIGVALSSGTIAIITAILSREQLVAWGWRIPFLLSILLVLFGLWLRMSITETPEFADAQARADAAEDAAKKDRLPVVQAIARFPKQIAAMIGTHVSDTTLGFINGVFVIGFATGVLGFEPALVLAANLASAAVNFVFTILAGRVSDKHGPQRVLIPATIALGLWAFPAFWLLNTHSVPLLFLVMMVGGALVGSLFSPQASLFAQVLPTKVRYSGMSVGFQVATVLGGGLGPIIAQWLRNETGGTTAVSAYILIIAVIAFFSVRFLTRPENKLTEDF
ncbi:MAG: MFS transporter [Propionibacteriaceae bacterium]|nr:MFS transporter [Propionibacteriaceae bacterium]